MPVFQYTNRSRWRLSELISTPIQTIYFVIFHKKQSLKILDDHGSGSSTTVADGSHSVFASLVLEG